MSRQAEMAKSTRRNSRASLLLAGDFAKLWSMKRTLLYGVLGLLVGAILSVCALVSVVSQTGYAHASPGSALLVYVSYWPLLVIGWDARELFVSFWVIALNILAWGLVGLLFGIVAKAFVAAQRRRKMGQCSKPV